MKKQIMVIAPHPDDETLGCGGTLLRHRFEGDDIHWLIVTRMQNGGDFTPERVSARENEISRVASSYKFKTTNQLNFPPTLLDTFPFGEIVKAIKEVFKKISPEILYLPYHGDVHTDHSIVFDAVASCSKWFREPSVRRILAYETLSETEFSINPDCRSFQPNCYINIDQFLNEKLRILEMYEGELGEFPFPRSVEAVRSLAMLRGATAGCHAAEAYMILKEIV